MFEMDYSAARSAVEARPLDTTELCGNWFANTVDKASGLVCEALLGLHEDGRYGLLACRFRDGVLVGGYASHGGYTLEPGAIELSDDEAGICLSQPLAAERDTNGRLSVCRIAGLRWARCPCDPDWFLGSEPFPAFPSGGILGEIALVRGGPAMIRNTDWSRHPPLGGLANLCRDGALAFAPASPLLS
jgi:hypothetical protein